MKFRISPTALLRRTSGGAERLFNWSIANLNRAGSAWVCGIMALICADFVSRGLFNRALNGVAETVALSIVICVFLQLPHGFATASLTRADLLLRWLMTRSPRAGHILQAFGNAVGTALFFIIAYASYPKLTTAIEEGEYVGSLGAFTAPTWPMRAIVVVGSILAVIALLILTVRHIRFAVRPPANKN